MPFFTPYMYCSVIYCAAPPSIIFYSSYALTLISMLCTSPLTNDSCILLPPPPCCNEMRAGCGRYGWDDALLSSGHWREADG